MDKMTTLHIQGLVEEAEKLRMERDSARAELATARKEVARERAKRDEAEKDAGLWYERAKFAWERYEQERKRRAEFLQQVEAIIEGSDQTPDNGGNNE